MTSAVAAQREASLRSLDRELAAIGRSFPARQVTQIVRRTALDALRRIVRRTPVDTGRARGNWQVSLGEPAQGQLATLDTKGGATIAAGQQKLAQIGLGVATGELPPIVWISNNVPYILVLEEGGFIPPDPGPSKDPRARREGQVLVKGGFSVQAPRGMVAVSVEELLQTFDRPEAQT